MKNRTSYILMILFCVYCSPPSSSEKNEYKILTEAYRAGHLTVVSSIFKEIRGKRKFTEEEEVLYTKTLFYSGEWKEFFKHWSEVSVKTPEMVLFYFKAVLLAKTPISVSSSDESKLIELLPVSPEACLLYLKFIKNKHTNKEKKLFLAQWKQFQTQADRLRKELGEKK
ncbi:hypothetical protein LEP1GSC195_2322 [Leptospira wolbachii serovar Codice str. CDC]|uniref:Lipoprotein n=1 Tax=Leptospira wolbachii serovar Codice str. CDC TaxID=1218599 RepID=R9A0Y6_9LEPT|nr:hypothetical protein [Leptospira wolbachii]EOQ95886.1 hypothetical protein LEP1GSC195_2322 [Leptospira wolbachii serovar Codice str. CDC]